MTPKFESLNVNINILFPCFQIHKNKTRKLMKRIKELDTFYNCTMAAIYEYIILSVIGITVYKSAAYNIYKTICLEKAASLLENENRCRLDLLYTENLLNDAGTCLRKCSVHINNLNYRKTYFLREVYVTIGTDQTFTESICQHMNPWTCISSVYCGMKINTEL